MTLFEICIFMCFSETTEKLTQTVMLCGDPMPEFFLYADQKFNMATRVNYEFRFAQMSKFFLSGTRKWICTFAEMISLNYLTIGRS